MSKINKNIILVENNVQVSKVIQKLLGKLYDIDAFDNAEDALRAVSRANESPSIVISSNILKKMNGDKFLSEVEKVDQKIIRLILTSSDNSRELVDLLQSSKAHLFVKKPFNSLEFLQVIRNMHQFYQRDYEVSRLNKTLDKVKKEAEECKDHADKLSIQKNDEFYNLMRSICNIIYGSEKFYFRSHTKNLSQISKKLAIRLGLDESKQKNVVYISLLSNHYLIGLPDRYRLQDPRDISDEDTKKFFLTHFNKSISNLKRIPSINKFAEYTALIYENKDGSGLPLGVTGIDIPKEMQIISLVNLYLNFVYRLDKNDLYKLKMEGVLYQSRDKTFERHRSAITYLYKKIKWFDHDLFYKFQEMLKKRDVSELEFNQKDLKLEHSIEDFCTPVQANGRLDQYISNKTFDERKMVRVVSKEAELIEEYVEMKLTISQLEVGMELSRDLKNYSGEIILKAKTVLDESQIEKLNKYLANESLQDKVYIKMQQND